MSASAWKQSCKTGMSSATVIIVWHDLIPHRSLDELDDDLLHELNLVARENQLAYLPFARSGRAEALLFDQYPELAERIERGRRAKIDAIVLSNKYASADTPSASFRAQSLEEISASPLRQRNRRRASNHVKSEAKSPALTPQLKGKGSAADLMFDMSDGEDEEPGTMERIKPPQFTDGPEMSSDRVVGTPESPWPTTIKQRQTTLQDNIEDGFISPSSLPPSALSGTRSPSQPWGTAPLASAKLDLKNIMAQASSDKPSGLALGLAQEERERARAAQPKMSQKERKRLQQAQQQGLKIEAAQPAPPAVSPWQAASYRKPSANQTFAPSAATPAAKPPSPRPSPQPSPQPSQAQSTPQLTMRQTIAKGKGKGKGKDASTQDGSSPSRPAASERGMSVSNTPIPVPMSVRHIPLPSHSPTSPSQNLSMMEILSLQEAEKTSIRDASAKRSLEEIQQEQEFQQWWEAESKRAVEQEEQAKRAAERAAKAAGKGRGKGRGGGGGGGATLGVDSKKSAGEGKKEKKSEAVNGQRKEKPPKSRAPKPQPQPATSVAQPGALQTPNPEAPVFTPPNAPTGPKADAGVNNGRGRGRGGHRGGRGGTGGAAKGSRPSAPPRNVQSAPAAPVQQV